VSVTLKQLQEAPYDKDLGEHKIDGLVPAVVCVMGTLGQVDSSSTRVGYSIKDGTTPVATPMVRWVDKDESNAEDKYADCQEGAFVKVFARCKLHDDRPQLQVLHMSVVTDYNELTHHMLECMVTHARNTKGPIGAPTAKNANAMQLGTPHNHAAMQLGKSPGMQIMGSANADQLAEIEVACQYVSNNGGDVGGTVQDMMAYLAANGMSAISMKDVELFVKNKFDEGNLYTTTDDDHFKYIE
jgi:replication factor A2